MCLHKIKNETLDCPIIDFKPQTETINYTGSCDYLELDNITESIFGKNNLNKLQLNMRGIISKQARFEELINGIESSHEVHALLICKT